MFYEEKSHPQKKRVDMFEGFWKTNLKDQGWFYTLFKLDFNSKQWTWRGKKWAATFRKRLSSILHIALGAKPHCQVTENLQVGFHHFFLRLWFQAQLLGPGLTISPKIDPEVMNNWEIRMSHNWGYENNFTALCKENFNRMQDTQREIVQFLATNTSWAMFKTVWFLYTGWLSSYILNP